MNCTQVSKRLPLFISDDLPAAELARVRAHVAQCIACAAQAEEYATMHTWLTTAASEWPPSADHASMAAHRDEALRASVRCAIVAAQPADAIAPVGQTWFSWRFAPLSCALAIALLLTLASSIISVWHWRSGFNTDDRARVSPPALPKAPVPTAHHTNDQAQTAPPTARFAATARHRAPAASVAVLPVTLTAPLAPTDLTASLLALPNSAPPMGRRDNGQRHNQIGGN